MGSIKFVDGCCIETLVETVAYVTPYIDGRVTERIAARELGLSTHVGDDSDRPRTLLDAATGTVTELEEES